MDREIELLIQNCLPCQAAALKNYQEPLKNDGVTFRTLGTNGNRF